MSSKELLAWIGPCNEASSVGFNKASLNASFSKEGLSLLFVAVSHVQGVNLEILWSKDHGSTFGPSKELERTERFKNENEFYTVIPIGNKLVHFLNLDFDWPKDCTHLKIQSHIGPVSLKKCYLYGNKL